MNSFEPVEFYEVDTPQEKRAQKIFVHANLFMEVWNAVSLLFLDPTQKRHRDTRTPYVECTSIPTSLETGGVSIKCAVTLKSREVELQDGSTIPFRSHHRYATLAAFGEAMTTDVRKCLDHLFARFASMPRAVAPFTRAHDGDFGVPDAVATVLVTLTLELPDLPLDEGPCRTWRFDTATHLNACCL